ncbi:MAG: dTDP-4-dehydrorhamnose 3,5-epimerase family protein [Verrucomicrobiota bacterium]
MTCSWTCVRGSPTFGQWAGFELTAQNQRTLYVPGGLAHGFQCQTDNCEVFYQMSEFYHADLARGLRWNDPQVGVTWPIANPTLSERDLKLPPLAELK